MSKQKLTAWFPSHIKPVHVGVYETGTNSTWQYWNGKYWLYCANTPAHAASAEDKSSLQDRKWRGLTEPADAAQ